MFIFVPAALFVFSGAALFAQTYAAVPLEHPVYQIITQAELRGLCRAMPKVKPYSEKAVINAINEIIAASDASDTPLLSKTERDILFDTLERFKRKSGKDGLRGGYYYEGKGKIRTTADLTFKADIFASGGIYNNKDDDQWGFTFLPTVSVRGDFGTQLSYDFNLFGNASRAVLKNLGTYNIGKWWFTKTEDGSADRTINTYANKAFFPFSYRKTWDGSVYKIGDLTASGLEGWCDEGAGGFGINSEIAASAFDDKIFIRFGRLSREWAGMDKGASLVFGGAAHPFLALEAEITPFSWFSLSTLTGILEFPKPVSKPARKALDGVPDLSIAIGGVRLKNPVIASSGTFGFGTEYASVFDVGKLGGIASKGLTLEAREGNTGIRLWETPSGLMNSIGLQNPGIAHFIDFELPEMLKLKTVTIANLSGSTLETYVEGAKLLDKSAVPIIELNISCPNVAAGGAAWGMTCANAETAVREVRAVTKKPLIVKLTPQAPDFTGVALACIRSGADALSIGNSFQGVAVDIECGVPVFDKIKAGFGGPAVRPIAVRLVWETFEAMRSLPPHERVPIVAVGGIEKWEDAVEFIMAGALAVGVGTNTFANPLTMLEVLSGIEAFMKRKGFASVYDMCGIAHER